MRTRWAGSTLTWQADSNLLTIAGTESGTVPTPHGVPQGSIMGPTLYLIYQNDLFTHLPAGSVTGYADDVTISARGGTASEAMAALQHLVDIVSEWSSANCLHLNPVKCKTMLIAPRKKAASQTNQCSSLVIKGASVAQVEALCILGVTFTSDLDWLHAKGVRSRMACKLGVLRRVSGSLNTRSRALIFKAWVKPLLNNCTPVWACCGGELTAIDKLLLRAKQTVINSKNTTILKSDFRHFGIATFADLSLLSVACQFFDCIHNSSQTFDTFLLKDFNASCVTRAIQSNKAYILKSKSFCDNCFYYHATQLWNTLPNPVTC